MTWHKTSFLINRVGVGVEPHLGWDKVQFLDICVYVLLFLPLLHMKHNAWNLLVYMCVLIIFKPLALSTRWHYISLINYDLNIHLHQFRATQNAVKLMVPVYKVWAAITQFIFTSLRTLKVCISINGIFNHFYFNNKKWFSYNAKMPQHCYIYLLNLKKKKKSSDM